jgi:hypothetical protein
MSDEAYLVLRHAVNLARNRRATKLVTLKAELLREGYTREAVSEALQMWATHERSKRTGE